MATLASWLLRALSVVLLLLVHEVHGRAFWDAGRNIGAARLKWRFSTQGTVSSSPALSWDDGTVYVGSNDHYFYAVNTTTGIIITM